MKAVAAAPQSLLRRLPAAWRLPSLPQAAAWSGASVVAEAARPPEVEFEWAREVIRRVGTVVHGYLLHFGREGGNAWDERRVKALRPQLVARLREEGVPAAELERAESLAETALLRTLADGRGQWILDATHAEAHGEYAISGFVGGNLENVVLDRTFVDEAGVRWIVDYKTSAHEGGDLQAFLARERERYAPQLERYAALMRGVDSRRPIRVGLYFPLLGGWVEWAPETC
jgi:hypothetical protein